MASLNGYKVKQQKIAMLVMQPCYRWYSECMAKHSKLNLNFLQNIIFSKKRKKREIHLSGNAPYTPENMVFESI